MLAGPGRHWTAARRRLAPYLEWRGFAIGAGAVVAGVLLLAGVIDSFTSFAWLVIFAAVAGFGIEGLRRQTMREFPDAERPAFTVWLRAQWDGVSDQGRIAAETARARHRERTARPQAADAATIAVTSEPPAPVPTQQSPLPPSLDDLDRLERLGALRQSGVLTEEEFTTMKARLVSR